ncbi:hypothetical protein pb186bvf_015772 [Paramecium bursaria]
MILLFQFIDYRVYIRFLLCFKFISQQIQHLLITIQILQKKKLIMKVKPDDKMNLMIISKNQYSQLVKISNNELIQEIQSIEIIWRSDAKFIFYLENLQLYSYQVSNQRKKTYKLQVQDIFKAFGNYIFGKPKKRNNLNQFSLYEYKKRKIIRSFINLEAQSNIRIKYNRCINLFQNKIFVHYILRFSCFLYAYVLYFNLCTGQRLIPNDYLENLKKMNIIQSNHFTIQVSNNGQFIGLQSQQTVFLLKEQTVLVKQFKAKDDFKFSECSQYFLRYDLNQISQIYVYDILNDIEKEYMLEQELFKKTK